MAVSLADLEAAMPAGGLIAGKAWIRSPEPFPLSTKLYAEIEKLSHRLHVFLRAANEFYYRSLKGKLPPWVAAYLDAGKPNELLTAARHPALRAALPGVIRPDLLLTEDGMSLAEIDSVPGGLGLTAWLGETYATLNPDVRLCGGAHGMTSGFRSLFPNGADIVVSREAGDYRPEMEWLASRLDDGFTVCQAEDYAPRGRDVYRFFELFDWPNIPSWNALLESAGKGQLRVSAPMKPWLEEKLWLALFWSRPLRELWRQELRENQQDALARVIPFGWAMDPTPWPHHAVLPRLELASWADAGRLSQRDRQLVLKRSGFSEEAWGSRSVVIGHDVSQDAWSAAVQRALADFPQRPWIMQEFRPARTVEHPYFDADGNVRIMTGRVRLCPYYFVAARGGISCGGVLATIVPADKKIIHGMSDGIIVPCCVAE